MRVDYTLPALQADALLKAPGSAETGTVMPFRDHIRSVSAQMPVSCEQQLRLDQPPFTGTYFGPPPRPRNLEVSNASTAQTRWRTMLARHGAKSQASSAAGPVQAMLSMLQEMQQMEDAIVSQSASLTRG